jgi:O-antigen ligase
MAGYFFTANRPDISIFNHDIFLVVGGWLLFVVASAFFALNKQEAVWGTAKHTLFALSLLLLCWSMEEKYMVVAAALIGTAMAVYGIYQWATTDSPMDVVGWMSNRNLLASGVFLCLMITGTSLDHRKWLPISIMLLLLILSFNRASILALIAAGGVLTARRRAKFLSGVLLVGVLLVLAVKLNPNILNTESLQDRARLWRASMGMISDKPAFGFGPGNWRLCSAPYIEPNAFAKGIVYKNVFYIRPHNEYLGMAAESGIPAGLLFLAVFVFAVGYALKANEYWIAAGIVGAMVIMYFSFPLERAFHSFAILMLIAMAIRSVHKRKPYILRGLKLIIAPAIFILCIITVVTIHRFSMDSTIRTVWIYNQYKHWDGILEVTKGMPDYVDYYNAPMEYYRGVSYMQKKDYQKAVKEFEAGYPQAPHNVFLLNHLACCYGLTHRLIKSAEIYKYVLKLNPNFELAASNYAKVRKRLAVMDITRPETNAYIRSNQW